MIKFCLLLSLLFGGCSSQKVTQYQKETPRLNLRTFFSGNIKALGIVQNRSKQVIERFSVDIKATWKNGVATLDEDFTYADNTKSKRVWKLHDLGNGQFSAKAGDVVGQASGQVSGNAFQFKYTLKVPVGDTEYEVHFDDWMFLLDKKTLLARTYMTKFGFNVGEVTLVMIKKDLK